MWLLNTKTLRLEAFDGNRKPKYAILSHRWQRSEAGFGELNKKIRRCCRTALREGISYVWIDTCCIDQSSSAAVQEAINSMYQWYRQAAVCYAYLHDVRCGFEDNPDSVDIEHSDWFTRGWTLQELLAPRILVFYDRNWRRLGLKTTRWSQIHRRTGIPREALENYRPRVYSVADIFCWAAYRQTFRTEDRAYSLLGLFDIQMSLLYSEGERAFSRLLEELKRIKYDSLLLASGSEAADKKSVHVKQDESSTKSGEKQRSRTNSKTLRYSSSKPTIYRPYKVRRTASFVNKVEEYSSDSKVEEYSSDDYSSSYFPSSQISSTTPSLSSTPVRHLRRYYCLSSDSSRSSSPSRSRSRYRLPDRSRYWSSYLKPHVSALRSSVLSPSTSPSSSPYRSRYRNDHLFNRRSRPRSRSASPCRFRSQTWRVFKVRRKRPVHYEPG